MVTGIPGATIERMEQTNQPNAASAAVLPAEVREAIENELSDLSFTRTLRMFAILTPLWPKPTPAPSDAALAEAQSALRFASALLEEYQTPGAEMFRVECRAAIDAARAEKAEAELAGWKADADRCREKWTHYEKLCDQLRAEVERLKEENKGLRAGKPIGAVVGAMTIVDQERTIQDLRAQLVAAQNIIRRAENHNEAGRAAIDAARAKEDKP